VLTPHQGVFDRTAFEDEAPGRERDDLVLEPIVVERPAVSYQRGPARTQVTQSSSYLSESPPTHPGEPSSTYASQASPTYLRESRPTYRREPKPTRLPAPSATSAPGATRSYSPPTTSRSRRAPPPTRTPARPISHAHRQRDDTGLVTSLGHGIPGRGIILLGLVAAFALAAVDIALNDQLSLFFSLGFVLIGLLCALGVRRSDLFTAGVLPPLLLAAIVGVFAIAMPSAVEATSGSISHAWVAGLAHHAGGLVSAHAAALLMIALRMLNEPTRRTRAF
jgi:hypothetical protein